MTKVEFDGRRHFASDNNAGICPEAMAAMVEANRGHVIAYGDDPWTQKACDLVREIFAADCEVFFVFNGTAANSVALAALCQSYHTILCHEAAHIETAECAAPEFFTNGSKVLLLPGADGKIELAAVEKAVKKRLDLHYPKARAISITQATEMGTIYSLAELRALIQAAKSLGLRVQMDGARFANAVVALGVSPREITTDLGVDVLAFGGTKNGVAVGELIVFFNRGLAEEFDRRCKQAGQLASKMRFMSAPWVGMLQDGAWLRHATHANAMARRLEAALGALPGLKIVCPAETNGVFVDMPEKVIKGVREKGWKFYSYPGFCRLMCSWDTTTEDVDSFAADVRAVIG